MGGSESTLAGLEGFQIVRVVNNSPAHVAGFVAFFDFITAVDKLPIDRDNSNFFFDYVRRNKDKAITCQVFNLRVRAVRDVTVVPSDCWGGVGLLGCNVVWESADTALESTWHVVDVVHNSPAFKADLMAHRDFILGMQPSHDASTITTFRDGSDFHSRVEEWRARMALAPRGSPRSLLVMVFDSVENSVKEVLLDMSGSPSLGVDVANGYLHVIPPTPNSDKLPLMKRFVIAAQGKAADAPAVTAAIPPSAEQQQAEATPDFPAPPPVADAARGASEQPRVAAPAPQAAPADAAHPPVPVDERPLTTASAPEVPAQVAPPEAPPVAHPEPHVATEPAASATLPEPPAPAPATVPEPTAVPASAGTPTRPVAAPAAAAPSPFPAPPAAGGAPPAQQAAPAFPAPRAAAFAAPAFPVPPRR